MKIDDDAFLGDTALKSVVISNDSNLRYIGKEAFGGCYSLETIMIQEWIRIHLRQILLYIIFLINHDFY